MFSRSSGDACSDGGSVRRMHEKEAGPILATTSVTGTPSLTLLGICPFVLVSQGQSCVCLLELPERLNPRSSSSPWVSWVAACSAAGSHPWRSWISVQLKFTGASLRVHCSPDRLDLVWRQRQTN